MTRYRNLVLFVLLAAVWGSAFMAIKAGLSFFPPVLFAAIRYDIAGVLMLGYAWWVVDDPIPRTRGEIALVTVGAVLLIAAYHAFLFVGEQQTTSAVAAVVVSLSPVLTTGFARAFLPSERLSLGGIAGLLLGLVGVVVLSSPDPSNLLGGNTVGVLLVFAASTCFALGSVLTQRVDDDLDIETMEAWAMLLGALVMHVASLARGETQTVPQNTDALFAIAYLSLAASAAGFLVYFELLERLGPIEINLVSYVAPVFAAVVGLVVLAEPITANTVAGFAVIFAGFCLLKRRALAAELRSFRAAWG